LGSVPDSLKHFNEEVVEVNKEFAESYSLQARMCSCR